MSRLIVGLLILTTVAWDCTTAQSSPPHSPADPLQSPILEGDNSSTFQDRTPRYRIGPSDVLEVTFEFSPEFNQAVTVQPDGFITMKAVGDLYANNQTVGEVKARIVEAYNTILNTPVITVTLKEFEKPYFVVSGQVTRPGKYDLRGEVTVTQAIAIAGGFDDTSRKSQIVLYRQVSKQWMEGRIIDVKKMHDHANLSEDVWIKPGDMIFVPQNTYSKIRRYIPMPGMGMSVSPF